MNIAKIQNPVWHGMALGDAIARAKSIHGVVIWSRAPDTRVDNGVSIEWGYWSDGPNALVRMWEEIKFDYSGGAK